MSSTLRDVTPSTIGVARSYPSPPRARQADCDCSTARTDSPEVERWKDLSRLMYSARMLGYPSKVSPALQRNADESPDSPFSPLYAMWVTDNHMAEGDLPAAMDSAARWLGRWAGSQAFGVQLDDLALRSLAHCHLELNDPHAALATMERLVRSKGPRAQFEAEDWVTLGSIAEDMGQRAKAEWAYTQATQSKGNRQVRETARRNLTRLDCPGRCTRPNPRSLARELARALVEGDGGALWGLASPTHFTFTIGAGESTFTSPDVVLPSLMVDLQESRLRMLTNGLEGCGSRRYLATDGWRGTAFAGRVLFVLTESRYGWEWTGVNMLWPTKGAQSLIHATYGEESTDENHPLEIAIKAPWPAGISMRAGGGILADTLEVWIRLGEVLGGHWWQELVRLGISGLNECGFGPGGFYYRSGSHHDNAFAIDFVRYPRGEIDLFGTSNIGRGTPILAVADGHIQELWGRVPTGEESPNAPHANYVVQRIWKSASTAVGAGWHTSPTPDSLSPLENAMTPYHAHYFHLMGPGPSCPVTAPANVAVSFGQFVEQGFVLGLMDSTGESQLDHLHFQITDLRITSRCDATGYCVTSDPEYDASGPYGGTVRPSPMSSQGGDVTLGDFDDGKCITSNNPIRNPVAFCALAENLTPEFAYYCTLHAVGRLHDPTIPDPFGSSDPFADRELCFYAYSRLLRRDPPPPPEVAELLFSICSALPGLPEPVGEIAAVICPPGTVQCADECVDVTSNPRHCGRCGFVCGPDSRGLPQDCVDGRCQARDVHLAPFPLPPVPGRG